MGVEKDLTKAFGWYQKLAADGNAYWQAELGVLYLEGKGVEQNYELAENCFRKAASSPDGDALAEYQLGKMHSEGLGIPKDLAKAASWYKKAADHKDVKAQFELGEMYRVGSPAVPEDSSEP